MMLKAKAYRIAGSSTLSCTDAKCTRAKGLELASRSIAWLLEESLLDVGQFRQIEPLITARSFQFHVQVIGYALPSGRYRVLEAIVDLIGPEPRVLYLRDLTKLGAPYPFATR